MDAPTSSDARTVEPRRQGEIIKELATPPKDAAGGADDVAQAVVRAMREAGMVPG
jgi:hypothetical protein